MNRYRDLNEIEISDDIKLFFVGTTTANYDIDTQCFLNHKTLDKICVENSMFGTSTYGYALAYAKQYGTLQHHGCIVAFELKPGTRFLDLRNPNEYSEIGFPKEIADIFYDAEPYFAINTNVPSTQAFLVPKEFVIAKKILARLTTHKKELSLLEQILAFDVRKINTDNIFSIYANEYLKEMIQVFKHFVKGEQNFSKLLTTQFTSLKDLLDECHVSPSYFVSYSDYLKNLQIAADNKRIAWLKNRNRQIPPGLETKKTKKTGGIYSYGANRSLKNPTSEEEYNRSLLCTYATAWLDYPPEIENDPETRILFSNYKLLFNAKYEKTNDPDFKFTKIDETSEKSKTLSKKLLGYFKLFELCKEYISNSNAIQDKTFLSGLEKIKSRLTNTPTADNAGSNDKDADSSKHVYIDFLQYIFFSAVVKHPAIVGVYCPEIRGFANIHRFSGKKLQQVLKPYAYKKEISAKTLYFDDRTIIMCKPLNTVITKTFGHTIDFTDIVDYNSRIHKTTHGIDSETFASTILGDIEKCTSMEQYKSLYLEKIQPFNNCM